MKKVFLSLAIIAALTIVSCKKEVAEPQPVTVVDSYPAVQVVEEPEIKPERKLFWSGQNLNLPSGKIVMMDCANCNSEDKKRDVKNNYVVIRRSSDSLMVIVRDIDEDTYLAIQLGEYIQ